MSIVSFYRFTPVDNPEQLRAELRVLCGKADLVGTVLIATEGVNGTLTGGAGSIQSVLDWLTDTLGLDAPIDGRWTKADTPPFQRIRVKVKNEIVALGRPDIRPDETTGEHVNVAQWNALISDPATLVVDTRNRYEYELGTFENAVDPSTDSFREFSEYAETLAKADPGRKVAMFCTGGIRCEKASALMMRLGFDEVYQLQGGILKYLEEVSEEENLWHGECFVFDKRVAVDRDRAEGGYVQCHACRRPLRSEDMKSSNYREGVSCPKCIGTLLPEREDRLEERRRQVALAKERGDDHIGAVLTRTLHK